MKPQHVTTAFDLIGFVLLAVALGMAFWLLWPPAGPAAAAIALLCASWFIDQRATKADDAEGEDS